MILGPRVNPGSNYAGALVLRGQTVEWKMAEYTFKQNYVRRPMRAARVSDHSQDISRISKRTVLWALPLVLLMLAACARIGNPEGWSGGAVAGDTLYIGTREGELVALDRKTGETLWRFELQGEERNRAIYGTPAVVGDMVYVGGYDGLLYALTSDGQDEWKTRVGGPLGGPIVGGPTVVDGVVLVGSSDGNLYAFDAAEGTDIWRFPTGNKVWASPAVANGVVYFGSLDQRVYAVSVENGDKVWEFKTGGAISASPLVYEGRVYVGSFDSVFYAISASTGKEVWRFPDAGNWYWSHAIAAEQTIFAPSLDGNLYALDAGTGRLLWTMETEGPLVGSPVVINDMIVVPSADKKLRVARLRDGLELDACNIGEEIRTSLVEKDGFVYLGARDRSIRAIHIRSNGNPDEEWVYFTDGDDLLPAGSARAC